jgi:UDP-2,3-diacylglucosamine hydrolase
MHTAIYLMGDIFDFWFEYKHAIPKGFIRLQGKLAELYAIPGIPIYILYRQPRHVDVRLL